MVRISQQRVGFLVQNAYISEVKIDDCKLEPSRAGDGNV